MKRRDFITTAGLAALAPGVAHAAGFGAAAHAGPQQMIELRRYTMPLGADQKRFHAFMEEALLPAYAMSTAGPIGAFTVIYGQTNPTLYVVLPFASMDDFLASRSRAFEYDPYASSVDTKMDDAHYVRYESSLMRAFEGMPAVEAPDTTQPRIFELRIYESHNMERARRKIEMFNKGEIDIFRATNLTPVFFGETLVGDRLPNLTYMITHPDMAARDANWAAFVAHPDWKSMSGDAYYADTVSNISDVVLRPTGYSQI